ncbi:hypothetical protein [Allostreptomyces psammosilenae]|uniref:Uncharacterized protein n=1 Tax=Allostreptomyces psammosilenae TaxID=1892865 RepID=A0A853A080_9ACTN|nr:hypothetical protein [Allostreptomyces psammosilenae]NYI07986.1 hypothetical protein [Allostreptomyces psammosilenae]
MTEESDMAAGGIHIGGDNSGIVSTGSDAVITQNVGVPAAPSGGPTLLQALERLRDELRRMALEGSEELPPGALAAALELDQAVELAAGTAGRAAPGAAGGGAAWEPGGGTPGAEEPDGPTTERGRLRALVDRATGRLHEVAALATLVTAARELAGL